MTPGGGAPGPSPPSAGNERPVLPALMLSLAFGGAAIFLVVGLGLRSPPPRVMEAGAADGAPGEAAGEPVDASAAVATTEVASALRDSREPGADAAASRLDAGADAADAGKPRRKK